MICIQNTRSKVGVKKKFPLSFRTTGARFLFKLAVNGYCTVIERVMNEMDRSARISVSWYKRVYARAYVARVVSFMCFDIQGPARANK